MTKKEIGKAIRKTHTNKIDPDREIHIAVSTIFDKHKVELEDAKAQGFREAIKEMGKVKG